MSPPSEREIEIFNAALELPTGERRAYLAGACADDRALRQRVEELLKLSDQAGDFLEGPASVPPGPAGIMRLPVIPDTKPGDRIGHYKLLQQIGEGGCGVVYMAEQEEPVRRKVALKVIKLGMDTKSVIARFEAERQALALMDHPNIAKVLDAGATETGRPYFVMELVRGIKITDYCDQHNLATQARLDLFTQVCRAVQHAHQKGIIHRDLKPSNILVTMSDGTPMPKVIDFGIAKATQGKLTDNTLFTAFEQFLGTPAYMSPEQAEMSAQDIDTRSDIYSLGVLLYELLTGKTPFDTAKLLQAGLDEMRRQIREAEPARPSTRLSTMTAADLTAVAGNRQAQPLKLIHLVRGDLDWIVMKCLEKERARRYETASGLAADIQRHLLNEPVVARPPSQLYAFQKLVRRHKLVFIGTGVVAAALMFALLITMVALIRIQRDDRQTRRAEDNAVEKLRSSYLAEARALRLSGQTGGRFDSLAIVQQAAAIRPDLAARNEAIACLAVSDLAVAKEKIITGHARNELAKVDFGVEHYAFGDTNENIVVRSVADDIISAVLPAPGLTLANVGDFSADGKYLIARYWRDEQGESDWVWDLDIQKARVRILQPTAATNKWNFYFANDFSSDSRFFFNSHPDGSISVYDLPSGRESKRFPGPHPYYHLIADPENERLACCSRNDPRVEIRDLASGQTLRTLTCPPGVSAVAWSPDGRRLATAGMDFNIDVWEVATGRQLAVLAGHSTFIMSLAFSHAGDLLASASYDDVARLWNPDSGRQLASHRGGSWQQQFSLDDGALLGWQEGSHYGSLTVGYSRECRLLPVPRDHDLISLPAYSADGRILAVATDGLAYFWDAGSGRQIDSFPLPAGDALVFTPDGRSLITVDRTEGIRQRTLKHLGGPDAKTWRLGPPRHFFDAAMLEGASLSQDGRRLAVTQLTTGQSFVFDLQNPAERVVLDGHPNVNRIVLSPDGLWAVTASWYNPLVKIWDARSGALVRSFSEPARTSIALSPDGRWLATSSSEYQLRAVGSWQAKSAPQPGFDGPLENFTAFSPDGRVMARTELNQIQLLDTDTEKVLATLEAPGSITVLKCQFSPDGSQLAAVQMDKQIQLWDLRLVREELTQMHLDWDLPSYPLIGKTAAGPVTLEIETDK